MEVEIRRWESGSPPEEDELLRLFHAEGLTAYPWSNEPGDTYSPHAHSYHKVIYVVQGTITWILPDRDQEILTQQGDRIDLPAGVVHGARVGPQGVICLEAHRGIT